MPNELTIHRAVESDHEEAHGDEAGLIYWRSLDTAG